MKSAPLLMITLALTVCFHYGAMGQENAAATPSTGSCPSWSAKFDQIDDAATLRILKAHEKQGWNTLVAEGTRLGVDPATQLRDGAEQLERSQAAAERDREILKHQGESFPAATAKDCADIEERGQPWMKTACDLHQRQNDSLAIEGMLDLLKCRASSNGGGASSLPPGTRVVSTIDVKVGPRKSTSPAANGPSCPPGVPPMPKDRIIDIGPEQAARPVALSQGEYLLLRFASQGATGFQLESGRDVLELPRGTYHLPQQATGLVKAVKPGSAKINVLGRSIPARSSDKVLSDTQNGVLTQWSGYVVPGTNFYSASGTWDVPQLVGYGNRSSSTWVGIDGTLPHATLIQAGTVQESDTGFLGIGESQFYWPFWEIVPQLEAQHIPYTVSPGDQMIVNLRSLDLAKTTGGTSHVWQVTVFDTTQQWNYETLVEYQGDLAQVEWIEEAPASCFLSICTQDTLANYQRVTFDNGFMLPGVNAPEPSFNPQPPSPLDTFPPPAFRAGFPALVAGESRSFQQDDGIASTPSNPDGDGDGFTVYFGTGVFLVPPGPLVNTTTLPSGSVGSAYSATLQVFGAVSPKWFSSQLPQGLSLNSATGVISGTPAAAGTFSIGFGWRIARIRGRFRNYNTSTWLFCNRGRCCTASFLQDFKR